MKAFAVGLSGAVLLALAAGCQPQLAEVELGDAEVQWNAIVSESYPGFRWGLDNGFDYICEMDCDFSHNPDDLVRLYQAAAEGNDVVVGSRYVQGVNVVNWPMSRLLMSYFASMYVRIVTRMPLRDATAGFVCYSRHALETIDLDAVKMKGYGFQIEMKYSAWRLGLKLKEVSIIFVERREGTSKMSGGIFREAFFGVLGLPFRSIRSAKNK